MIFDDNELERIVKFKRLLKLITFGCVDFLFLMRMILIMMVIIWIYIMIQIYHI